MMCCNRPMVGVQYIFTSQDYDGVSEFACNTCGKRIGRWSGVTLAEGQLERRYGGEPHTVTDKDDRGSL